MSGGYGSAGDVRNIAEWFQRTSVRWSVGRGASPGRSMMELHFVNVLVQRSSVA